jgi:uncharacterized protein YuzE
MKITYDPEVDAAYIELREIEAGGVASTVLGEPDSEAFMINLDFDKDENLIGIEIMSASKRLPDGFLARFGNREIEPR